MEALPSKYTSARFLPLTSLSMKVDMPLAKVFAVAAARDVTTPNGSCVKSKLLCPAISRPTFARLMLLGAEQARSPSKHHCTTRPSIGPKSEAISRSGPMPWPFGD